MITLEFREQVIPAGKYRAVLEGVSEAPPSKFRPNVERIKFDFRIVDPGYEKKVFGFCNKSAHPKSNLIRWLLALGKQVVNGKVSFGEDLIGKEVILEIDTYERTDHTTGIRVKDVFAYKEPMHVSPSLQPQQQLHQAYTSAPREQDQVNRGFVQQPIPAPRFASQPVQNSGAYVEQGQVPRFQSQPVQNAGAYVQDQRQPDIQVEAPRRSDQSTTQVDTPAAVKRNAFVREIPAEKIRF